MTYNGETHVKGKRVTGLANGEEEEVQLTKAVPFLVEDELLQLGAIFEQALRQLLQHRSPTILHLRSTR